MNNDNEKTLAFRLSSETLEQLRAAAARHDRSCGAQARAIIRAWLAAETAKTAKNDTETTETGKGEA